jgi:hypothetical protein
MGNRYGPSRRRKYTDLNPLMPRLVLAGIIIGAVVAWTLFLERGRFFIDFECLTLYGKAESAADSAKVDSTLVVRRGLAHPITCGDVRRDNFPPLDRSKRSPSLEGPAGAK